VLQSRVDPRRDIAVYGSASRVGPVPTGRALDRHFIGRWELALRLLSGLTAMLHSREQAQS